MVIVIMMIARIHLHKITISEMELVCCYDRTEEEAEMEPEPEPERCSLLLSAAPLRLHAGRAEGALCLFARRMRNCIFFPLKCNAFQAGFHGWLRRGEGKEGSEIVAFPPATSHRLVLITASHILNQIFTLIIDACLQPKLHKLKDSENEERTIDLCGNIIFIISVAPSKAE